AKLHLARFQVGDHDHALSNQYLGIGIRRAQTGEDLAQPAFAQVDLQADELVGFRHQLGRAHDPDPQIQLLKILDRALLRRAPCFRRFRLLTFGFRLFDFRLFDFSTLRLSSLRLFDSSTLRLFDSSTLRLSPSPWPQSWPTCP